MKLFKYHLVLFLIVFCAHYQLRAQSISAQVSGKRVQVGVPFEFAVVISGATTNYNQPNLRDFDVVSGPNQSSSIQNINGVMNQQYVFSYALVARKEGRYLIPSANAIVNGQRLETQPISIEVVRNAGSGQQAEEETRKTGSDLFIKTTISKAKCYLGEQILISQKVYCRNQIIGYQKSPQPSYDGFYSQPQESPTKSQLVMENVDGVQYYTHEVLRVLATANKAGRITLNPVQAEVVVRRQSARAARSLWEQLMGGGGYEDVALTAMSKPAVIEVLPLPEAGKPDNFNGAVGVFTSKVELSKTQLKANEALNLKFTISGKGNLRFLETPKLQLPESFESYDPKVTETATGKLFDFLIIPRREGNYELSGLDFSYFNLDSKKYVNLTGPTFNVQVSPGKAGGQDAQVYAPQSQVKETENDIRYIKKGNFELDKTETDFFNSFAHLLLILLPLLGLSAALILKHQHRKNNSDIVMVNQRKAASVARKRLVNAEKMMREKRKDEFYTEVLLALTNYLSFRLNIHVADLSKEKVQTVFLEKQIDLSTNEKLLQTLQTCEYAKYAPGSVSGDLEQVYKNTVDLVTEIENQLNRKK